VNVFVGMNEKQRIGAGFWVWIVPMRNWNKHFRSVRRSHWRAAENAEHVHGSRQPGNHAGNGRMQVADPVPGPGAGLAAGARLRECHFACRPEWPDLCRRGLLDCG